MGRGKIKKSVLTGKAHPACQLLKKLQWLKVVNTFVVKERFYAEPTPKLG